MLMETIGMTATNPNSVRIPCVMAPGDSNVVRNYNAGEGKRAMIIAAQTYLAPATGGDFEIRSPLLHDVNVGMNFVDTQFSSTPLFQDSPWQGVKPQDPLLFSILTTSAGAIESAAVTILYDDVNGSSANLIDYKTLLTLGKGFLTSASVTFALGATTGWGGAVALNAAGVLQSLKANTPYAILGCTSTIASVCAIAVRGIDTGNVRVGMPGNRAQNFLSKQYFVNMSKRMFIRCIPVFNSANAGNTFLDVLDQNIGYAGRVSLTLAELKAMPQA